MGYVSQLQLHCVCSLPHGGTLLTAESNRTETPEKESPSDETVSVDQSVSTRTAYLSSEPLRSIHH